MICICLLLAHDGPPKEKRVTEDAGRLHRLYLYASVQGENHTITTSNVAKYWNALPENIRSLAGTKDLISKVRGLTF